MPCYRCGVRQTDPVRGPSAWRRGVSGGAQVLVCPECQRVHDWTAELDVCARCGSAMLVRALGETHCRSCGAVAETVTGGAAAGGLGAGEAAARRSPSTPGLSEDVAAALDRLFRRGTGNDG
jgi:hypothetical protein